MGRMGKVEQTKEIFIFQKLLPTTMSDEERDVEDIYDAEDLDEIKQVNKSPSLDQIKMIPIGKCLVIKRNIDGKEAEIEVCRRAENEWKINGPHPFGDSEMKLKDMKPSATE